MSIKSALKDPVVRVVLAIGLVPLVWMGLYWIAMVPVNNRYQMLPHHRDLEWGKPASNR